MRYRSSWLTICVALAAAATPPARADGVRLSYGGRLTDSAGAPRTGSLDVEVRLFAAGDATAPVWTRLVEGVELSAGGVFQLELEAPLAALGSVDAPV
jgi:hypothetical protein